MEMLIIIGFLLFATLSVFGLIDLIKQINKLSDIEKEQNRIWKEKLKEESNKLKILGDEKN